MGKSKGKKKNAIMPFYLFKVLTNHVFFDIHILTILVKVETPVF